MQTTLEWKDKRVLINTFTCGLISFIRRQNLYLADWADWFKISNSVSGVKEILTSLYSSLEGTEINSSCRV